MPPTPDDPKPTDSVLHIRDFGGYAPAGDPHETRPGKTIQQINCQPIRPGELRVRPGAAFVKFDT